MDALWELGVSGSFALRPALKRDLVHFHYQFKERTDPEISSDFFDLLQLAHGLPHRASHLLQRLEAGDIQINCAPLT
jgi:hypothetical protein